MLKLRTNASPTWVTRARSLGDDLNCTEKELLQTLAEIVRDWPASNCVAQKALDLSAHHLAHLAENALEDAREFEPQKAY